MKKFLYHINIQFLGFRYSGWQKQTNAKTVQEMVDKTFNFIFEHDGFKTLGAGRTDAKVSANQFSFQLFVTEVQDTQELLAKLNYNFPADIRALDIRQVDSNFNIMNDPKIKKYFYMFTCGEKMHPFCAPFMVSFEGSLDIDLMKRGAKIFEGEHNFYNYCYKPSPDGQFVRTIDFCELVANTDYTASFFPKSSWILNVHGKGFMRQQIRLMMGALVKLGRGEITMDDLQQSLNGEKLDDIAFIAPSSGLTLDSVIFK